MVELSLQAAQVRQVGANGLNLIRSAAVEVAANGSVAVVLPVEVRVG
jgi:hypothetical protein